MNSRQAGLMIAAMFVALSVEIARENGVFTGHPVWMYVCLGIAGLIILWALLFPGKKTESASRTADIKDSLNPSHNLIANPTINVQVLEPRREVPTLAPKISPPLPLEPKLKLGRVWKETIFRMRDEFFFHSRVNSNMLPSYSTFHCIVAEIKNIAGHARNIKTELAFEKGIIGPLTWIADDSNTISLDIGDSGYILLAAYLWSPLPNTSAWRIPVNTRKRGELPGATLIELTQGAPQSEGSVKINILHPESGRIVTTFEGHYQWPGNELEPKFTFSEEEHGTQEENKETAIRTRP